LQLTTHDDVESFLAAATPLLLRDEARHNLILGICSTLATAPSTYKQFHLWTVDDQGRSIGAAVMTPPFNLAVARPETEGVLDFLAQALHGSSVVLPGVTGSLPETDEFASAWRTTTGEQPAVRRRQGIYQVTRPVLPTGIVGRLRAVDARDRGLLHDWMEAFIEESGAVHVVAEELIDRRLDGEGGLVIWDNNEPVSFAGFGGQTPNGIRVGPVYTPPPHRRNGYASALVAELSAQLLAHGRDYCFLYTDLANPTANHIYLNIGYRTVSESAEYAFQAPMS
jgi:predicted GNAT family acetyltransferase